MSVDYFFFVRTDDISEILTAISQVEGVRYTDGTLEIDGLFDVNCTELDRAHRELMLHQYGDYGLDVNWLIRGTFDKDADLDGLYARLFRCAAAIVNKYPEIPLSLMREAENFYVFNTIDRVLIPHWTKDVPVARTLFDKWVVIDDMIYE